MLPGISFTMATAVEKTHGEPHLASKNVSELIARRLRPFSFVVVHKPTKSLRGTLVGH